MTKNVGLTGFGPEQTSTTDVERLSMPRGNKKMSFRP
jgi:hypothetical protein